MDLPVLIQAGHLGKLNLTVFVVKKYNPSLNAIFFKKFGRLLPIELI